MTYAECIQYLYDRLPVFHRTGPAAYKPGLGNIVGLCEMLGHPERSLKCVHVAGTNGKGSVSHLVASVLMSAGYKTGLHTSPHLVDFRERIRVNGREIPEEEVIRFVTTWRTGWEKVQPSFFELSVAMAFWWFRECGVDVAVIEVGLGGRLDSTNVVQPEVSVITQIGFDHMNLLGHTLSEIAAEKAGIIKPGVPVAVGYLGHEAEAVVWQAAARHHCAVWHAADMPEPPATPLYGSYQWENTRTALAALEALRSAGWRIPPEAVAGGYARVIEQTGLRGRWETLREYPRVICDVAHNEDGIRSVVAQLEATPREHLRIVLGVAGDKDVGKMLSLLPKGALYYFCRAAVPRGLPAEDLCRRALEAGLKGSAYSTVAEAYERALADANPGDLVFVGGSFFTVAEVLSLVNSL